MSGSDFPFHVTPGGRITTEEDENAIIRDKIIQVLTTVPGERVNEPTFGCGLINMVFEPNDSILASTMEFTVYQALNRWLENDIKVDGVDIETSNETITVEIAYTTKIDLSKKGIRVQFGK